MELLNTNRKTIARIVIAASAVTSAVFIYFKSQYLFTEIEFYIPKLILMFLALFVVFSGINIYYFSYVLRQNKWQEIALKSLLLFLLALSLTINVFGIFDLINLNIPQYIRDPYIKWPIYSWVLLTTSFLWIIENNHKESKQKHNYFAYMNIIISSLIFLLLPLFIPGFRIFVILLIVSSLVGVLAFQIAKDAQAK